MSSAYRKDGVFDLIGKIRQARGCCGQSRDHAHTHQRVCPPVERPHRRRRDFHEIQEQRAGPGTDGDISEQRMRRMAQPSAAQQILHQTGPDQLGHRSTDYFAGDAQRAGTLQRPGPTIRADDWIELPAAAASCSPCRIQPRKVALRIRTVAST
jgi:hypothetical protein